MVTQKIMFLSEGYGLARFALNLKPFLRQTSSIEEGKTVIRDRMQARDRALVEIVKRFVFDNHRSPYRKLFQAAGCELADVEKLTRQEGVEGSLQKLAQAGVYVTFDEFKGRRAAVRGSQTFHFRDTDFNNLLMTGHYRASSGGSGGRPSRITIDLDYLADRVPLWAIWFEVHDLVSSPLVFLTPFHHGMVNLQLICAGFGNRFVKWFATASGGSLPYRLTSAYLHALMRRAGGFPKPEFVSSTDFVQIGDYLTRLTRGGLRPAVNTSPSQAIRVCLATLARGESLRGTTFLLGYEPLTPARRQTIEASGATVAMTYGFSEGGTVGQQCRYPAQADDVHIALDAFAVVTRRREVQGEMVDALALTALRPTAPKVLLNAEIGDQAIVETRTCGCPFDELGYVKHLHTIRSFEKLTGLGVTFAGADLFRLLEEKLPKKFGGNATDYQLIEEQDSRGLPRYSLIVSPEVGVVDEKALVAAFLEGLAEMRRYYRFMVNEWSEARLVRVVRRPPLETAAGKLLPFRTLTH